jgi:Cytochrome P450
MIPRPEDTPFDVMEKQRKKYGNIVGLFLGIQPAILISGMEDVKEVLAKDQFNYRPNVSFPQHKMFGYERHGNLAL